MIRNISILLLAVFLAGCGQPEGRDATPEASEAPSGSTPAAANATPTAGEESSSPGASPGNGGATGAGQTATVDHAVGPDASSEAADASENSAPSEPADPGAAAILRRAERTYAGIQSMEADFVQRVTVPLLGQTQNSRGKIFHRRPDRFLMRFSDPEGDVIVADGRHLWMYYPSTDPRQVLRTTLAEAGSTVDLQQEFLSDANRRFEVTHLGVEDVAGRPADKLRLIPREPSQYLRVTIWVDQDDAMVRRFEMVEQNESVRRLELRNLRPNVSLPDELFRFTPPPGAEVFDS